MLFVFDSWHEYTLTLFGVDGIVDPVIRRDGRVAEGAPLLRAYTLIAYRGFESLSLRHTSKAPLLAPFLCLTLSAGVKFSW